MRERFFDSPAAKKTITTGLLFSTILATSGCKLDLPGASTSSTSVEVTTPPFSPESHVHSIDQALAEKMQDVTLRDYPGCVTADTLRVVEVPYHGFNGQNAIGSIVVHHALAEEVGDIFEEVYATGFQIEHIATAEDITTRRSPDPAVGVEIDDELMAKNITSGFNCRTLDGKVSKHGYGGAIDINPLQNPMIIPNPFVTTDAPDYSYSPPAAEGTWDVSPNPNRLLSPQSKVGGKVIDIFKKRGWRWGGEFKTLYDGQHFDKAP
jgi:hypothetical protein